ncbi:MAG: DNA polymerase III subunit delta [Chloroflexi bacterium]|nr:DNA polymerase III subunit delta [Chloroflexota bacterium]MCL5076400.1 DNA polymerase III subunit delta [Chloroflexota bacterium]
MIYILRDDPLGWERIDQIKQRFSDRSLLDLNTTTFDGRKVSLADLVDACESLPFLAEKRLVLVKGLLSRFETRVGPSNGGERRRGTSSELERGFAEYISKMPETTDLVLIEESDIGGNSALWKAVEEAGGHIGRFKPLSEEELYRWITERVSYKGGRISALAVQQLAIFVGHDLRLLANEIDKLIAYAGMNEIGEDDVLLLSSDARRVSVFKMVDALGQRDRKTSLRVLHELLAHGEAPAYLLVMITRQFRLLIQVKELVQAGISVDDIGKRLHLTSFINKKLIDQARKFTMPQLERIYQRLVEVDTFLKRGRLEPTTALDLLIVDLSRQ